MMSFRHGSKKPRKKVVIGPELRADANYWQREINKYISGVTVVQGNGDAASLSDSLKSFITSLEVTFSERDLIRIAARRSEELKARGYPEEWIKKDLEKLMEGVA